MEKMEDMDLNVVSQLLNADDSFLSDSEYNSQNNEELCQSENNNNNNSSIEPSSTEIEMELKLIQERMSQLQEQLQKKKSIESFKNSQSANTHINVSGANKTQSTETDTLLTNKKNKNKLIDVDVGMFSSQCSSLKSTEKELLQNNHNYLKDKAEIKALHSRELDSSDDEMEQSQLSEAGRKIKRVLANPSKALSEMKIQSKITWNRKTNVNANSGTTHENQKEDNIQHDIYSGLRIINPLISSSTIKLRMEGRKFVRMSSIRLHMRGNDIEGDWVTSGVIIKKIPPATSKNGKAYSIWKMSDLKNCDNVVSLFLFGEVHKQYWKTSIGTVIAFLNASIMPDRKASPRSDDISLSVDHPGKVMILGASKDFGYCRSHKKNGQSCQAVINLSQGEYCQYHVQQEYTKLSRKRMELQASYSGTEPRCLRNKILNKQPVIYGGQMYSANTQKSLVSKKTKNGQLTLDNLKLQRKAELFENKERKKYKTTKQLHLNDRENDALLMVSSQSEFFRKELRAPTAGSRNFLRYLVNEEENNAAKQGTIRSITAKELLKLHKQQLVNLKNTGEDNIASKIFPQSMKEKSFSNAPQLGRGFKPGEYLALDIGEQKLRSNHSAEIAKLKAIKTVREKGPLNRQNPNAVKKQISSETIERIRKKIKHKIPDEQQLNIHFDTKRSNLGEIDLNSEKIKDILDRKSSHAHEIEMEDLEKQEAYFTHLEKKEQMENKMLGVTEIVCDVISCQKCIYTAYQPSELCKSENHPIKRHKAIKRFFQCVDCKHRTWAFTKLPKHCCRNCGNSSFERTSMMKPKEVKLSNETLLIRGEEQKFL